MYSIVCIGTLHPIVLTSMVLGVGACHGETISINLMLMLVLFFYAGEENLIEITDYLFELDKTHIYHLGLVLGLSHHRVKQMKDSETFLDDMIAAWLQKVDQVEVPTWQRLVKALRHKRVGQTGIASEIENDKLVTATHE